MVPPAYQTFLAASTAASAGLIGLLFVSVSIAPERVFGGQAEATRQAQALSAFTALVNVFFISFGSLIPNVPVGPLVTIVTVPAVIQTLSLLLLLPRWRSEGAVRRGIFLFLASTLVYGYEIAIGVQLWRDPANTGSLTGLLELLLGAYAIGLGRAWELLGAPQTGFIAEVTHLIRAAIAQTRGQKRRPPNQGS